MEGLSPYPDAADYLKLEDKIRFYMSSAEEQAKVSSSKTNTH